MTLRIRIIRQHSRRTDLNSGGHIAGIGVRVCRRFSARQPPVHAANVTIAVEPLPLVDR